MSRFSNDGDNENPSHWWATDLQRALTSGRGQKLLKEFEAALLAMPKRELTYGYIVEPIYDDDDNEVVSGSVCAVGAFAAYRKVQAGLTWDRAVVDLAETNGGESDEWKTMALGRSLGLARTVAYELGYQNDEVFGHLQPPERWLAMLGWVRSQIKQEVPA